MFNALKYTEELEKAGFTRMQAEASLKLLVEVMNESFATKADLLDVKAALKAEISDVKSELKTDVWRLESKIQSLESSIKEMEYKLTIKLGTLMAISIGMTATLVKLLPGH